MKRALIALTCGFLVPLAQSAAQTPGVSLVVVSEKIDIGGSQQAHVGPGIEYFAGSARSSVRGRFALHHLARSSESVGQFLRPRTPTGVTTMPGLPATALVRHDSRMTIASAGLWQRLYSVSNLSLGVMGNARLGYLDTDARESATGEIRKDNRTFWGLNSGPSLGWRVRRNSPFEVTGSASVGIFRNVRAMDCCENVDGPTWSHASQISLGVTWLRR